MVIRQNTITGYYCINCSISVKLTFDISKHCSVGNKTRMLQLKWQNILLSSHWSSAVSSWNWAELWIIPETTVHCLTTADTIATYAPCPADCSSIDNASKTAFHNRRQHHSVSDLSIQHTCIKCKFSNNNLPSIIYIINNKQMQCISDIWVHSKRSRQKTHMYTIMHKNQSSQHNIKSSTHKHQNQKIKHTETLTNNISQKFFHWHHHKSETEWIHKKTLKFMH